jgi:class 3 adenylate cyclase
MASGVITTDREERITLCNRAAGAILNRPPSGLLGRRLSDLLPGVAAQVSNQIDAIWRSEQTAVGVEVFPSLPGRGAVSLSLNLAPLKDASRSMQGVAIVVDDTTEKRRLQAQRRLFARMVSPAVIDQLDPDQLQLGGKKAEITTLFADIRDFTRFSERLHPERLVSVLNLYLAAAAEAILAETGTIDKFLGDAVMAWFNAPFAQPDHALRAVRAALGIRRAVDKLQGELPGEFHLSFGAGIHFGEAVLGLVGAEERLEYTAIGDSVNTAKRIQENAAAGQILISREVYALVRNAVSARAVEPIQAKGKSQPVEVYEVVGMN